MRVTNIHTKPRRGFHKGNAFPYKMYEWGARAVSLYEAEIRVVKFQRTIQFFLSTNKCNFY